MKKYDHIREYKAECNCISDWFKERNLTILHWFALDQTELLKIYLEFSNHKDFCKLAPEHKLIKQFIQSRANSYGRRGSLEPYTIINSTPLELNLKITNYQDGKNKSPFIRKKKNE